MNAKEYKVFARKYRPKLFYDVIGQESTVKILKNSIEFKRVAHAFLLTGIRGTGKTTLARVLAMALNCESIESPEPCLECDNCTSSQGGEYIDVIEIDAASRTGVDDVREIIESASYVPMSGKYKIYIIDEIHMLSKSAFNALLKTLEEPPEHVKFIFATTEKHKIPATVLSRCHKFDLRRIDKETMISHLKKVLEIESESMSEESLELISDVSGGSVRDALSLLDQAIVQEAKDKSEIRNMLGIADETVVIDILKNVLNNNIADALDKFNETYMNGADPLAILRDIGKLLHAMSISKIQEKSLENPTMEKMMQNNSLEKINRLWHVLFKSIQEINNMDDVHISSEMALIRISCISDLPSPEEIINNMNKQNAYNIEPAAMGYTNKNKKYIKDVKDILEACKNSGKELLYHRLKDDMEIVNISDATITLQSKSNGPDIAQELEKVLKEWTKEIWSIIIKKSESPPSHIAPVLQNNDAIKSVLEYFPDVNLQDIIIRDKEDGS